MSNMIRFVSYCYIDKERSGALDKMVFFRSVKKDNLLTNKIILAFFVGVIAGVFLTVILQLLPFWVNMSLYIIIAVAILATISDAIIEKKRIKRTAKRKKLHLSI